jgi:hypothetical protein
MVDDKKIQGHWFLVVNFETLLKEGFFIDIFLLLLSKIRKMATIIGFNLDSDFKITNEKAYYNKVTITLGLENEKCKTMYNFDFKNVPEEIREEIFEKLKPYFKEGESKIIDY